MSEIRITGLCRNFGTVKALDHIDLELKSGQIYGFVGPNGSGKTTLLRILSGLDIADAGSIIIDGDDVTDYPEVMRQKISLMPDSLPDRSDIQVWEYLDFYGRAAGLSYQERQEAVAYAAGLSNLDGLMEKFLCELSKGMKQQVSLARVLLHMPDVLLMDEPTAGLDPRARIKFRESLLEIAKTGKTVLISSHILSELEDMIQQVVLIEKGQLLAAGSVAEVAGEYRKKLGDVCRIVAQFADDIYRVQNFVRTLDFVASAEVISPTQLLITVNGGDAEYQQAVTKLFQTGLPITGINRQDMSLEGLFMNVTKGEVQ